MSKINNKFPGKDVSADDLKNKFPLLAKKNVNHRTIRDNVRFSILLFHLLKIIDCSVSPITSRLFLKNVNH